MWVKKLWQWCQRGPAKLRPQPPRRRNVYLAREDRTVPSSSTAASVAAAAEAMRRILVDNARRKKTVKHGGQRKRLDLSQAEPMTQADPEAVLDLDEALTMLAAEDPQAAEVAKLRIFAAFSIEEAAQALSLSRAHAYRQWAYARAWLHARLRHEPGSP